jgi:protein-S-isoprenylcysteine O-methyltransferase Ste14
MKFALKVLWAMLSNLLFFGVLLLVPAGTWKWDRAWVLLALSGIGSAIMMIWIFRRDPALLKERMRSPIQKDQPLEDKIAVSLLMSTLVGVIIFTPLDVFRFHLLSPPTFPVAVFGLFLFLFGWLMTVLAFRANTFAAPVVKHQSERNQVVVDHGVYAIVRHPMYTGVIILIIGEGLWLGSYAAALLTLIPAIVLAVRIMNEEKFLRTKLTGYDDYTRRVRFRLIPFIW